MFSMIWFCVWIRFFIIVIFLVLLISKGISRAIKYTGLGSLDTIFGFFFGFIKAYIISVCIFSGVHIVYNHDKWPVNLSKSLIFPYLEKGSNYLLEKFPDEKTYQKILDFARLIMHNDIQFVDITDGATHYHADYVKPDWAKTKTRTTEIGDHIFYRWEKK